LQRKARLVVFLYPLHGYKNTARPCNPGFWRGSAKKAHIFFLYWRVDPFTKYLGGFLIAPKGFFIDGNKIIE
jgi:hypothetical protein